MTVISRSIPGLFGGVSQQIPAMRHPTHCALQENGLATLVDGLSKREGIQHIKSLAMTGVNSASVQGTNGEVFTHVIDRGTSGRFLLIVKSGNLMVYDLATGAPKTVAFPDGKTYLNSATPSSSFRAVTVADYTFLVNRGITVATSAALSPARPVNRGLIYVKQVIAALTYRVNVDGVIVTFTSDANPTTKEVVDGLYAALVAALPPASYSVGIVAPTGASTGPVISVTRTTGAATSVVCSDDYGNLALLAVHEAVTIFTDLPANLGNTSNFVAKVSLNPGSDKGAYWVTWDTTTFEYKECAAPGLPNTLDPTTMPHKLVLEPGGTFTLSRITDWTPRKSGDDTSNPMPSFVGQTMRDVFFLRNRLGFLSADSAILSKAGRYYTFFGDTAQQVLDTDPIDLSSTAEQVVDLEWAVPFNENLLIWSDKQQFVLTGGDILSPKNARMAPSTAFEAYLGARPEPLGNKCVFATTSGDYTSIRLLKVSLDTQTNEADEITDHVPRYLPKDVLQIEASSTAKMVAVVPRTGDGIFLFKYEDGGPNGALSQKAWCNLPRPDSSTQTSRVIRTHWVDRRLYIIRFVKDTLDAAETGGRFMLELLDFQSDRADAGTDFSLRLDRKIQPTSITAGASTTTMVIPYWERGTMTVLKCVLGKAPVILPVVSSVFNADGTMTLEVNGNRAADILWAGKGFLFRYRFSEVFFRDATDSPVQHAKLSLKRILLRFVSTGFFRVRVTPYLRQSWTYDYSGNLLGAIPLEAPQLATGDFSIPVNADPKGTIVDLESDSFFPATFPYAEWVGNINMKAKR